MLWGAVGGHAGSHMCRLPWPWCAVPWGRVWGSEPGFWSWCWWGGGRWKGEHTRASRTAGREELWAGLLVAAGAVRKKAMLCWEDGLSPQPAEPLACPLAPRGPVGLVPSGVQQIQEGPWVLLGGDEPLRSSRPTGTADHGLCGSCTVSRSGVTGIQARPPGFTETMPMVMGPSCGTMLKPQVIPACGGTWASAPACPLAALALPTWALVFPEGPTWAPAPILLMFCSTVWL